MSTRLQHATYHLGRVLRLVLADHPRLYYPVMRRRPFYKDLLISDRTELVIEGYPRSGNTFAVAALQFAQPRALNIARHTHSPAQVIEAARRRLPLLVLVREPRDAAVSLVIREPPLTLELALRRYIRFHRRIHPYRASYVVGTFDEVTTDYTPVLERLNSAFGLKLAPFQHTPANREAVFKIVEEMERRAFQGQLVETRVARPSPARAEPKARLLETLARGRHRALLEDCHGLYQGFLSLAGNDCTPGEAAAQRG